MQARTCIDEEVETPPIPPTLPFTGIGKLKIWQAAPVISVSLFISSRLEYLGGLPFHSTSWFEEDRAVELVFKTDPATSYSPFSLACSKARRIKIMMEGNESKIRAMGWLGQEIATIELRSKRPLAALEDVEGKLPYLGLSFNGETRLQYKRSSKSKDTADISSCSVAYRPSPISSKEAPHDGAPPASVPLAIGRKRIADPPEPRRKHT